MSVELYSTVRGSKPLHRFIKGQPKAVGVVVLVLGSSLFINAIMIMHIAQGSIVDVLPSGFLLGVLFIICGIQYVLTEHNPTKKTVTISLALSIVTILGSFWSILTLTPNFVLSLHLGHPDYYYSNATETDEALWSSYGMAMGMSIEGILLFYSIVGAVIFIVMSTLAGGALRSTKSQAIVMMTTTPTETPVE